MTFATSDRRVGGRFRHEAVFYRGLDDMVETVAPFVLEGLEAREPVLVAELPDRIAELRGALGAAAAEVTFLDMPEVGGNPARIIPAWREFVARHPGRPVRGVGEPVWAGRREAELDECRLHESLLNVAFDDNPWGFRLLCPYDADGLSDEVLADAMHTHPVVGSAARANYAYGGHPHAFGEFERRLPDPPAEPREIRFGPGDLGLLRSAVRGLCDAVPLEGDTVDDLVLAVHELACNSIEHGGGGGLVRGWVEPDGLVVEVSDDGLIEDPLVGREAVLDVSEGGRGIWMANHLCDLVQVRSSSAGTAVRLHTWT